MEAYPQTKRVAEEEKNVAGEARALRAPLKFRRGVRRLGGGGSGRRSESPTSSVKGTLSASLSDRSLPHSLTNRETSVDF